MVFRMKSGTFHAFHWKAPEKLQKTADSTQICHFDLVFHRVQREGQLGISYILVVFGAAHVCLVLHVCVYGACMHTCLVFCIIWFHYRFHKIQHNFTKTKIISWDFKWLHEIQLDFTKSNKISSIPQEFTGLHKIQKDFLKFVRIWLKSTEFHRISLNPIGFHKFSWNPTQVHVKSTRFHYEFHDISH